MLANRRDNGMRYAAGIFQIDVSDLKMSDNGSVITDDELLINKGECPSGPHALLGVSFVIAASTFGSVN
jgi:hypothetical protein